MRLNGCKFTLTGTGQAPNTALVDIVGCTNATTGITIQIPGCQKRIPQQNGLSHVVATNLSDTPHTVTVEATVQGITFHQAGVLCPDGNGHKGTSGSFQGDTIIKATQEDSNTQVTEHGHEFTKFGITGPQVNLTST